MTLHEFDTVLAALGFGEAIRLFKGVTAGEMPLGKNGVDRIHATATLDADGVITRISVGRSYGGRMAGITHCATVGDFQTTVRAMIDEAQS